MRTTCDSLGRYDRATKQPLLVFQGLHLQFSYGQPKQGDVRDKQLAASAQIVRATDQLIADLDAAGVPDTAHGRAFAEELAAAFRQMRDSVDDVHHRPTRCRTIPAAPTRVPSSRPASAPR